MAVDVLSRPERQQERGAGADVDRDVGPVRELAGVEGVLDRHVERDVAGDHADADHGDGRIAEGHDERDRVVGGGVGVDEERSGHPAER